MIDLGISWRTVQALVVVVVKLGLPDCDCDPYCHGHPEAHVSSWRCPSRFVFILFFCVKLLLNENSKIHSSLCKTQDFVIEQQYPATICNERRCLLLIVNIDIYKHIHIERERERDRYDEKATWGSPGGQHKPSSSSWSH